MRKVFFIFFILFILWLYEANTQNISKTAKSTYAQAFTFSFCDEPILYDIGVVDSEYGITQDKFEQIVRESAQVWNEQLAKPHIVYSPTAELKVNLVFDERQNLFSLADDLSKNLETEEENLNFQIEQYESFYNDLTKRVATLNSEIQDWNKKGGAPPQVYEDLLNKQEALKQQIETLDSLAAEINAITELFNSDVELYNSSVGNLNELLEIRPEEGIYDPKNNKIDIFFYRDDTYLKHTLIHEFGHAIGLDHVSGEDSIMYISTSNTTELSSQDRAALATHCRSRDKLVYLKDSLSDINLKDYTQVWSSIREFQ